VTGNFVSAQQAAISFQTPGRIKEYLVEEGDRVEAGAILARLDSTILEFQVAQAEAALALAKARLQQTQAPVSAEQAAAAQAALRAAQSNYARVSSGPLPDELAAAKANVDRAKAALDQAQALYDKAGGASNPYSGLLPTSVGLQQATSGYEAAIAQFNLAKDHPTATELAAAASQLAQALAGVAQLTPTAENLAIAQAGVDQAQAAVDLAKASLNNSNLIAPFAGTAVLLGPKVGEYVNPGTPIVILADLSRMQVQANVDELTLGGLRVGQPAALYVDALGAEPLRAHISKMGLFATGAGGVVTVPVTLDVDPTDAPIYPGLSATVQFEEGP
jgi:multidrug resistance efflux pump